MKDFLYNLLANFFNRRVNVTESPACAENVAILVMRHFACELPKVFANERIFRPIHCGAANATVSLPGLRDDSGDNISKYNPFLNEMTGIYWMAHNLDELGQPDFIGTDHYRRFLQWTPGMLRPDAIVASSLLFHRPVRARVAFELDAANRDRALGMLENWLKDNGHADFSDYLNGHLMYVGNMFIMPRETFTRYFTFIERCIRFFIELVDSDEIPLRGATSKEKRLYGYLLEHLTSYWIWQEKKARQSRIVTTCIQQYDVQRTA